MTVQQRQMTVQHISSMATYPFSTRVQQLQMYINVKQIYYFPKVQLFYVVQALYAAYYTQVYTK